jgi:hypothetical protein
VISKFNTDRTTLYSRVVLSRKYTKMETLKTLGTLKTLKTKYKEICEQEDEASLYWRSLLDNGFEKHLTELAWGELQVIRTRRQTYDEVCELLGIELD